MVKILFNTKSILNYFCILLFFNTTYSQKQQTAFNRNYRFGASYVPQTNWLRKNYGPDHFNAAYCYSYGGTFSKKINPQLLVSVGVFKSERRQQLYPIIRADQFNETIMDYDTIFASNYHSYFVEIPLTLNFLIKGYEHWDFFVEAGLVQQFSKKQFTRVDAYPHNEQMIKGYLSYDSQEILNRLGVTASIGVTYKPIPQLEIMVKPIYKYFMKGSTAYYMDLTRRIVGVSAGVQYVF
ncbi:MAG: hypothetical protein RLZZ546_1785 [Bacteroidota bacterium]|jgi:hypothetical protein